MNFLSISGIVFWVFLVLFITLRIIYGKNWAAKAGTSVFIGKGLIMSIKNLIRETRERNIKDETVAEVGAHVIWRVTRIGLIGLLIASAPIAILLQQNKLLSIQNKQIDSQNKLFSKQNEKIDVQNKSIKYSKQFN